MELEQERSRLGQAFRITQAQGDRWMERAEQAEGRIAKLERVAQASRRRLEVWTIETLRELEQALAALEEQL